MLMIPLMFTGAILVSSFTTTETHETYLQVKADSSAKQAFLDRFTEILDGYYDNGKSVCDVKRSEYLELVDLYSQLSKEEREEVNQMPYEKAGDYTIEDLMNEIIRIHYGTKETSGAPKQKLDQSTTIIIAVVVSIVGMSGISVLFILKKDNYIE